MVSLWLCRWHVVQGLCPSPASGECGTCCSAQVCRHGAPCQGLVVASAHELLLDGTSPSELALPAGRLEQLTQILAGCCCLGFPPGCWIPPPWCVL